LTRSAASSKWISSTAARSFSLQTIATAAGPENPFSRADLKGKFDDCAGLVLPPHRLDAAFTAIEAVDSMADVRQLVKALA
jgi:hypothetical protein